MQVAGAFVDMSRDVRTLKYLATHSTRELSNGTLNNVPKAMSFERSALKGVLEDARAHPKAFVGALDVPAGVANLESIVKRLGMLVDTTNGAIKAEGEKPTMRAGNIPVGDDSTVSESLHEIANDVQTAFEQLGRKRALPDYEPGPPTDLSTLAMADEMAPEIVARGHRSAQFVARMLLRSGLGAAMGVRATNASTVPKTGAAIIAPNHISERDPGNVVRFLDRPMRPFAKRPLFDMLVVGSVLRKAGALSVELGNAESAFAKARTVAARGELVTIYPPGMIHPELAPGPHGRLASTIASEMSVPVIPVGSWGSGKAAWRGETRSHRPMTSFTFGEAIPPPPSPTHFNERILNERIARAQDELTQTARQDYERRLAALEARRPYVRAGAVVGVGTVGGGELLTRE